MNAQSFSRQSRFDAVNLRSTVASNFTGLFPRAGQHYTRFFVVFHHLLPDRMDDGELSTLLCERPLSVTDDSVTCLIAELRAGDPEAANRLWARYFERLATFARNRISNRVGRVADEEDVAVSVLQRLCSGMQAGSFPAVSTRDDLWPLLLTIARGKISDQHKRHTAQKRGGGKVRGHSVLKAIDRGVRPDFAELIRHEVTPELLAQLDEESERLLRILPDDVHRKIAVWRMEGHSNDDMATKLDVSVKTVERKLRNIRTCWSREVRND